MTVLRTNFTRRNFCAIAGSTVASLMLYNAWRRSNSLTNDGRLTVRPRGDIKMSAARQILLILDRERDAILHLPKTVSQPHPLLVMLHGATQSAEDMFWYLGSLDEAGVAVLAPNSRDNRGRH